MQNLRKKAVQILDSVSKNLFGLILMKRSKKDKIIDQNTDIINNKFDNLNFDEINLDNLDEKLSNYLSLALRITHYYGNLRIKYVTFNFTFVAFFASILAIYISIESLWYVALPIMIGFIWYFSYFLIMLVAKFDTIAFEQKDLQHYSCIMQISHYPNITEKHMDKFIDLIKREKKDLIKDNLKTLVLQYIYQANYLRVGLKMRICLIFGSIDLSLSMIFSMKI